ncbi:hypothetical protein L1D51_05040 [Pseudoalteromonas shioyasakiensis]|uniref:hypothetical protein n=1 Tax=Pseudoalteromonas shioyasakiensis TaxID=1190813 RepID=UPI001EFDC689|nr:hypothetical protein [Pseudoalteromonas shioyasakiensis]MCG9733367.1 hypothetical protein [Pseudoalteromonas shioyasakiensis]
MQIDNKVQEIINKVNSGELNELINQLDGSDFGIQIPVFEDQGTIKMMLEGYSQIERDLVISISQDEAGDDALPVGWFGKTDGKDSSCKHNGTDKCRHCTGHTGQCRHCTHTNSSTSNPFDAPELDYHGTVSEIENKQELLDALAQYGLGLTLVHGHSNEHMFTKLPAEYISVVANGKTEFRLESDVASDPSFVPSAWRVINGNLNVVGGHSQLSVD